MNINQAKLPPPKAPEPSGIRRPKPITQKTKLHNISPAQSAAIIGKVLSHSLCMREERQATPICLKDCLSCINIYPSSVTSYEDLIKCLSFFSPNRSSRISLSEYGHDEITENYFLKGQINDDLFSFGVMAQQVSSLKGYQLFDEAMLQLYSQINKIEGEWIRNSEEGEPISDNYIAMLYHLEACGALEDIGSEDYLYEYIDAAFATWTGIQAARYGFTRIESIVISLNEDGQTIDGIDVHFTKPPSPTCTVEFIADNGEIIEHTFNQERTKMQRLK